MFNMPLCKVEIIHLLRFVCKYFRHCYFIERYFALCHKFKYIIYYSRNQFYGLQSFKLKCFALSVRHSAFGYTNYVFIYIAT